MLFKEIIAVYSETYMKTINTLCGQTQMYELLKNRWYIYLPLGFLEC
jgi:hypothetical protein